MKKIWNFTLAVSCWVIASLGQAATIGSYPASDRSFSLKVESIPPAAKAGVPGNDQGIQLNKLISLTVTVLPKDAATTTVYSALEFDAVMPAHNHGMVVKPVATEISPGQFRIDGVKLHMVGDWEFIFKLKANGTVVKLTAPFKL